MTKLTLLNPHADDFIKTPVSFHLAGRRGLMKYAYLIDIPQKQGQIVDVLVDGTLSSLIRQTIFIKLPTWVRRIILWIELTAWIRINHLKQTVRIHWSPETIPDRRMIYLVSYKNCVGAFDLRRPMIEAFEHKIVNMSHYFILTQEKARNIKSLSGVIFTSEADLRSNPYFAAFFSDRRDFLVLPFAVAPRFCAKMPVEQRRPTCGATGSFHNLYEEQPPHYYQDFLGFFHSSTYHPLRKQIYERQIELQGKILCRVSPYRERTHTGKQFGNLLTRLKLDCTQRAYFSFDIVDFYNGNIFAVVGEELSGLPAIGFFEAMACGCILLGEGETFYEGVGLQAGIHYLAHDGTIENILATMEAALRNPATLQEISAAAQTYVATQCRPEAVWTTLQTKLRAVLAPATDHSTMPHHQ